MATKRRVMSLAATVILLLFLLLIVWLAVKTSTAFYIVALVDFTTILSIFLWVFTRHAAENIYVIGAFKAVLAALASVVAFVTLVVLLWVRVLGARRAFYLTGGAAGVLILSLLSWLVVSWAIEQRRNKQTAWEGDVRLEYNFLRRFAGLPMEFSYEELVAATENFRSLVGKGGCSSVFKGVLDDGTAAAVKRIDREARLDREFRSEVAAIASVQHVNLVRLLGYCLVPGGSRFLVYEFFPNSSLDAWIFPSNKGDDGGSSCLTWAQRSQVAMDVARALAYLHHDCRSRVLHLDIKPENILLDGCFRACVSDFGMSRLVGKDESSIYTTLRGTRGYFAPEWFSESGVSEKSDVYSFGLVLLEMVGGRRNVATSSNNQRPLFFPRVVDEKLREGRVMEVVDQRLLAAGGVEDGEVAVLARVALWCIQDKPERRPSMAAVVDMLRGYVAVDVPPPSPMFMAGFLATNTEFSLDPSASRRAATSTTDEMGSRLLASSVLSSSTSSIAHRR